MTQTQKELIRMNTTVLAYMGDAVYEQFIREHIIDASSSNVSALHRRATGYVKASAQAMAVKALFDNLTEQEQNLVKRARNRKPVTKAKNADPLDYRWATAMEALVGYLYLDGQQQRLAQIMKEAIEIIERSQK